MSKWRAAFMALSNAGFTDQAIAELAGCKQRHMVCSVRNGTYKFDYDPGYDGGRRIVATIDECIRNGVLDYDPMAE